MKIVDEWFQVEVKCTKENATEMTQWLKGLGLEIERAETALGEEPKTMDRLLEQIAEHGGSAGFIFEIHFPNEESAMLAKMKYGN